MKKILPIIDVGFFIIAITLGVKIGILKNSLWWVVGIFFASYLLLLAFYALLAQIFKWPEIEVPLILRLIPWLPLWWL